MCVNICARTFIQLESEPNQSLCLIGGDEMVEWSKAVFFLRKDGCCPRIEYARGSFHLVETHFAGGSMFEYSQNSRQLEYRVWKERVQRSNQQHRKENFSKYLNSMDKKIRILELLFFSFAKIYNTDND